MRDHRTVYSVVAYHTILDDRCLIRAPVLRDKARVGMNQLPS